MFIDPPFFNIYLYNVGMYLKYLTTVYWFKRITRVLFSFFFFFNNTVNIHYILYRYMKYFLFIYYFFLAIKYVFNFNTPYNTICYYFIIFRLIRFYDRGRMWLSVNAKCATVCRRIYY